MPRNPASQKNPMVKYYNDYIKFFNKRLKDGGGEYLELKNLFEKRVKNEEWKTIYPLNNYDFNYKNYVLNSYNPYALGITSKPDMANLIDSVAMLGVYTDAMIKDPTPDKDTVAGIDDSNNSPYISKLIHRIKYQQSILPLPYPTFKEDYPEDTYPTTGIHSSSYFIKVGECKSKINNKNQCVAKQFKWLENLGKVDDSINRFYTQKNENFTNIIGHYHKGKHIPYKRKRRAGGKANYTILDEIVAKPAKPIHPNTKRGDCYRPKFLYINNAPRGMMGNPGKGFIPAIANDILSITPDKLLSIMSGNAVEGGGFAPCVEEFVPNRVHDRVKIKETFISDIYYGKPARLQIIVLCCIIIAIVVAVILAFN